MDDREMTQGAAVHDVQEIFSGASIAQADYHRIMDRLPTGVLLHRQGVILYANPVMVNILGLERPADCLYKPLLNYFQPESWKRIEQAVEAMGNEESGGIPGEVILIRSDDKEATLETITAQVDLAEGALFCTVAQDISQRKQNEDRIRHQANYDNLTGLPNRMLFMDRLQREVVRATRQQHRVALMFIDLDRFKWVNDTLGHAAGDELLREVSTRLQGCLRKSDTVARMGGDEFTAILPDMARGPFAERVASEVLGQLVAPFTLCGQEVMISGSIGIAIYPDDAASMDELLRNADIAMYRAKSAGRNGYRFFTPDMHAEAQQRMELEKDLHYVLERQELVIHYQPIVDLNTRQVMGAECLLRWIHPKRGFISPALFIPMAEEIGMISKITEWTIRTACAQAAQWRRRPGCAHFFVSVNLSCTRCRDLSVGDNMPKIFQQTGLPADGLVLEITENILSEDANRALQMLNQLVQMGVNLWLDDFGTGHSSLSVLKRLPVSGIKIDRSFVPSALSDPETVVLVEAILSLARSLDREVIGEGIEAEAQAEFLSARSCRFGQGYLFLKPEPAEEFVKVLG
ncbi:MAG: EAL domain-containing protein [Magnetococcales bacterium]|nr:EAL domain-containing protein [Magnetococcales bacterium]MBF0116145.1 EAL domain-containing protein [Magnetococcales bacterium]